MPSLKNLSSDHRRSTRPPPMVFSNNLPNFSVARIGNLRLQRRMTNRIARSLSHRKGGGMRRHLKGCDSFFIYPNLHTLPKRMRVNGMAVFRSRTPAIDMLAGLSLLNDQLPGTSQHFQTRPSAANEGKQYTSPSPSTLPEKTEHRRVARPNRAMECR